MLNFQITSIVMLQDIYTEFLLYEIFFAGKFSKQYSILVLTACKISIVWLCSVSDFSNSCKIRLSNSAVQSLFTYICILFSVQKIHQTESLFTDRETNFFQIWVNSFNLPPHHWKEKYVLTYLSPSIVITHFSKDIEMVSGYFIIYVQKLLLMFCIMWFIDKVLQINPTFISTTCSCEHIPPH